MSERPERFRREGVFAAFEIVRDLPEPILAIVISDGTTNLDGIYEGAKNAAMSSNRVFLVIIRRPDRNMPPESFPELMKFGERILRPVSGDLCRAIDSEIPIASHSRSIPINKAT